MKLILAHNFISCCNDVINEEQEIGILIENGVISQVSPLKKMSVWLSDPSVKKIDAGHSYVMPGLIDAHVHLCFDSSVNPITALDSESEANTLLRMVKAAQQELYSGVTTVRDCGAKGLSILALRDAIQRGDIVGSDIIACGPPITVTGGHCHFLGLEADGFLEVQKAVRTLCREGVDFIKVMVSGGNMTRGSNSLINHYNLDILEAITYEAHMRGKKVAGHIHTTPGIANAIQAGFDTIEHCSYKNPTGQPDVSYSQELAEQLKEKGIAVCPAMGKSYILPPEEGAPLPDKVAMWRDFQNSRFETTRKMFESGVSIIAGTDAGCKNSYFYEFGLTLEIMHEKVGLPVSDVLLSATGRAAKVLGISETAGTLEKGKYADLIFVPGNPAKDLSVFRNVIGVMKKGNLLFLNAV